MSKQTQLPTESEVINGEIVTSKNAKTSPNVSYTKASEIKIHSLNQYELRDLKKGIDAPIILTVSMFCLSIFLGFIGNYLTTNITDGNLTFQQKTLLIIGIVALIICFITFIYWLITKNELKGIIEEIEKRPPI